MLRDEANRNDGNWREEIFRSPREASSRRTELEHGWRDETEALRFFVFRTTKVWLRHTLGSSPAAQRLGTLSFCADGNLSKPTYA